MTQAQPELFSAGQALGTLLAVEGFLLAAISLAINLAAPNQERARSFGRFEPIHLAQGAAIVLGIVAVGAGAAWMEIFTGGHFAGIRRLIVAVALLIALIAQPVLAILLAFGAKTK